MEELLPGKIIFNIDVMLAKRKMSVTELADKVGITIANMSILKTGKAKAIKVSTLIKGTSVAALREAYVAHCRYNGKSHPQIRQRRIEEFDTLYKMVTKNG